MEEPLPPDVLSRVVRDFGDRADDVTALLRTCRRNGDAEFLGDRLVRCVVHAAAGNESRVRRLLDLARQDGRDVIVAGEYDGSRQARDLRASFLIDSPEKFWVGEIACLMAVRGYQLTALETRPASAGPFVYTSDGSEGRATFVGPKGNIEIEKRDRQWLIHGHPYELTAHELNRPFSDESAFRDAVSGYLLSNVQARPDAIAAPPKAGRRLWWKFWT